MSNDIYQSTQDIYLKAFWIEIDRLRNKAGVTWTYLQGGDTPRAINGTAMMISWIAT